MNIKNKTAQSLILANALIIGLPGPACAHEEEVPAQDAVQRPASPGRAMSNQDGSTSKEDTTRGKSSSQGLGTSRDSGMTDRSSQGIDIDRDGRPARPMDRPSQDRGTDRADDHGGGH